MSVNLRQISSNNQKSFLLFLVLVIGTAFISLISSKNPALIGILSILWGLFGLYRLIYLNQLTLSSKIKGGSLPLQILFGSSEHEIHRHKLILKRFIHPDILIWFCCAIGVAIFNNQSPSTAYNILLALSTYGIFFALVLIALSFSQTRQHVYQGLIILIPFAAIGLALTALTATIQGNLSIETYIPYVLALSPFVMLFRNLINRKRSSIRPLIGLIALTLFIVINLFIMASQWSLFTLILLTPIIALTWGSTIRYK